MTELLKSIVKIGANLALGCPRLLGWLALGALLALSGQARAAHARFENQRVYLPVVEAYPFNRSYELKLSPGAASRQFELVSSGEAAAEPDAASAYFDGDLLVIPEFWIGDVSWWAELRDLGEGRFRLSDYGRNEQEVIFEAGVYRHSYWERIPGQAKDIGVGADGTVWAVGESRYGYDYGLYHWDGRRWYESDGSAVRVDVDALGRPWVINGYDEIYVLERGRWERIRGAATDIGIGADGSVWALGVTERRGGYEIFQLGAWGWVRVEGTAVRIDVEPDGTPWVVNQDDHIYRLEGGRWRRIPGLAKDIGIGADGSVWVIGTNDRSAGYGIYQYNGRGWTRVDGSARQISVGPDGEPWVVNDEGDIYRSLGY